MNVISVMENKWRLLLFLLLGVTSLLLWSCNNRPKDANTTDYLAYIRDDKNGLIRKKEIGDMEYEIRYLTPEAMALAELKDISAPVFMLDSTIKTYGQLAYFRVNIGSKQGHLFNTLKAAAINPDEAESYLNFDAEKDFQLSAGTDTSSCVLYSFSRSYGLSNAWQLMLAFDVSERNRKQDLVLTYEDHITGSGILNFRFSGADINNVPKLIY